MSLKPRIFISHSAHEGAPKSVLEELAAALREREYRVLLDQDGLQLGTNWRSTLNAWIGGCDVAIMLLSESALESSFVAYEASILAYRANLVAGFRLFPVFLDPVNYERIESSPLAPSRIHDRQSVVKEVQPAEAIAILLDELDGLEPAATLLDKPVQQISDILVRARVPDHYLTRHLALLGVDFAPWLPEAELTRTVAASMMAAGLERSVPFIRKIRAMLGRQDVSDLTDLLASSWVDYCSIEGLPRAARERRAVGVNASSPLVANMYVISAALQDQDLLPRDSWLVVDVPGLALSSPSLLVGADATGTPETAGVTQLDGLEVEIRARLAHAFGVDDLSEVEYELKIRADEEPVFVALPANGVTPDLLTGLRSAFQDVTFFVLTGPKPPPSESIEEAGLTFLRPELEDGAEERFCGLYAPKRRYLLQGLA